MMIFVPSGVDHCVRGTDLVDDILLESFSPRCFNSESISSMNTIQGAIAFALDRSVLMALLTGKQAVRPYPRQRGITNFSVLPCHLDMSSSVLTSKRLQPYSRTRLCTSTVLPHPDGPYRRIPFRFIPGKSSGAFKAGSIQMLSVLHDKCKVWVSTLDLREFSRPKADTVLGHRV